jgi:hypothetical protein
MMLGIRTELRTVFEVTIGEDSVQFTINDKDGSDAEVSFGKGPWVAARLAYHAIRAFEDRFPGAFDEDGNEVTDGNGVADEDLDE